MPAVTVNDLNNAQLDVNTIAIVATSSAPTVTDRLGNTKNTLSGMNAAVLASAAAVQGSIGYLPPVAYAAGINLTVAAQTVGYSGQTYAPILSALPFTTSGTFETAKFRLIQGVTAADLAARGAASTIGFDPTLLTSAMYSVQWGINTAQQGFNILRLIPPSEWPAIANYTTTLDLLAIFNTALANNRDVYVPEGQFCFSATLTIPDSVKLAGSGAKTLLKGLNVVGPLVQYGLPAQQTYSQHLSNVTLGGSATKACAIDNAVDGTALNVWVSGTFTDGFYFANCFPGNYKGLYTNGAAVSRACFEFGTEVNACHFDNLYTSTFSTYNFLYNGTGHGNTFTNPTAQGGRYGFYVQNMGGFGGLTVNGLYTENCVRPIVIGVRGNANAGGAKGVVFNGATLAGPETTHPYYSECIAAIELNSVTGAVFNGINFSGMSRASGGFPVVTITGDGSGALAMARVTPTGQIHSVEVLSTGSGYTTATAAITIGGTGATATVAVAGGKVAAISVTAAGTGYKRTQTPTAVVFDHAQGIKFSGSSLDGPVLGSNAPLYPHVMQYTGGNAQFGSTIIMDDVSVRNGSIGVSAHVQRVGTGGDIKFAVVEYGSDGLPLVYVYNPIAYP